MIKKIRIKNFKCYGPQGADFDLSKINFIYGDNSVGKSSFLQFLNMLVTGIDHEERYSRDDFNRHLFKGGIGATANEAAFVTALIRAVTEGGNTQETVELKFGPVQEMEGPRSYALTARDGRVINAALWDMILPKGDGQDRIIHKVAPRNRQAFVFGETSDASKQKGLGSQSFLNKVEMEMESNKNSQAYLNDIFQRLGIHYSCVADATGEVSTAMIHDNDFNIDVPVTDVGTGIAGLMDLAFTLKNWRGGILALEEPEANVNELQIGALVRVLAEEAMKRPLGQLIVECHSKLMIMMLASLVHEGVLSTDETNGKLRIVNVTKESLGTKTDMASINPDGTITWPGDYFPAEGMILKTIYGI